MSFYLLDKPIGITSQDLVIKVKKQINSPKVGHSGTLDPFASGLLIIASDADTKFLDIFLNQKKTYEGEILFGVETDTHDVEGKIVKELKTFKLTLEQIENLINSKFLGSIKQVPHKFSAVKVNGQKSYDLAREGKELKLKAEPRRIYSFKVKKSSKKNVYSFEVEVSSGTYIRSLVRDISHELEIPAHLISLRRTKVDMIDISKSTTLENLKEAKFEDVITIKKYAVDKNTIKTLLEGKAINFSNSTDDLLFSDTKSLIWAKRIEDNKYKIHKNIYNGNN